MSKKNKKESNNESNSAKNDKKGEQTPKKPQKAELMKIQEFVEKPDKGKLKGYVESNEENKKSDQ